MELKSGDFFLSETFEELKKIREKKWKQESAKRSKC